MGRRRKRLKTRGSTLAPRPGKLLERLVQARMENLGLLCAIAAEVEDLSIVAGLKGEVRELEEYDRVLALAVHVLEIKGDVLGGADAGHRERLLSIGAQIRGEVRALLPWQVRARVHDRSRKHPASPKDVWDSIQSLRRSGRHLALCPPLPGRVPRHFELPDDADPQPWIERERPAWVRTIATQHRVTPSPRREVLVGAIAAALRDPQQVGWILAEELDAIERSLLARYTACQATQRVLLSDAADADLAPDWDGRGGVPALSGARLRAFGLLYLGWMDGLAQVVTQPADLRRAIARRLLLHHPDDLADLSASGRYALEAAAADVA